MNGPLLRRCGPLVVALLLLPFSGQEARGSDPGCADCHDVDAERFADTVHGFLECADCHAGAAEMPHDEAALRADCATCHEGAVEAYAESAHGQAETRGVPEMRGCASCHGAVHDLVPRADPASPLHPERLPETCGTCHANPDMVARLGIPVATPLEAYRGSVHARAVDLGEPGATCDSCHGSHAIFGSGDPRSTVFHGRVPETCGACHAEISAAYAASVHGLAAAHGAREAPVCTDCHGEHRILAPDQPGSPVFATNIPLMTCGRCHADVRLSDKYGLPVDSVRAYGDSYHGLASRAGAQTVAHCASCHGVHDIQPSSDPRSHVSPANLAATCGRCHPGAGTRFAIGPVHVVTGEPRFTAAYLVRWVYLPLIWLTVSAMLLHNFLDLRRKSRSPRTAPVAVGAPGVRMPPGFRLAHGTTMVTFALLVYTGFALTSPESWWAWPLVRWESAGVALRGTLHRAAAVALLAALAFHVAHLAVDRRARACMWNMRPCLDDWHELRERLRYYLGRRPDAPPTGTLGYVEKVEYLAFLWGMVVMAVTGFLLWFESAVLHWLPSWVADMATAIHYYEAILATAAIAVWHLYWVIFDPLVYPMDWAWWTGVEPPSRAAERTAALSPGGTPAAARRERPPGGEREAGPGLL